MPVVDAVVGEEGIVTDWQIHRRFHGGPLRALCLFPLEQIIKLQGEGHLIYPGSVGENVTTVGLDWARVVPGCRLALGDEVIIEITSYTVPCQSIAGSFTGRDFTRIAQKKHPGESRVYARILQTGRLMIGQQITVLENTGN